MAARDAGIHRWISQPAISSASSTARWIDCTVDSMFTTTPFFRPRDGWLPMPMISSAPSGLISPTMATTLRGADVEPDDQVPVRTLGHVVIAVPSASVLVGALARAATAALAGVRQPMAKPFE